MKKALALLLALLLLAAPAGCAKTREAAAYLEGKGLKIVRGTH